MNKMLTLMMENLDVNTSEVPDLLKNNKKTLEHQRLWQQEILIKKKFFHSVRY